MSQGITIKGKNAGGQSVTVKVDDDGQLYLAGSTPPSEVTKFDPSENTPTYIGTNTDGSALDSANTWTVLKFTRNGLSEVTQVQKATGAWADRATLIY